MIPLLLAILMSPDELPAITPVACIIFCLVSALLGWEARGGYEGRLRGAQESEAINSNTTASGDAGEASMDRYTDEALVKMQATQSRYRRDEQNQMVVGLGCSAGEEQVSTRESLMNRLRNSNSGHEKLNRALAILEAHPEFEDFLWLLRSNVL